MNKYGTIKVRFVEPIKELDDNFDDTEIWGVENTKEWMESFESTRFTQISPDTAIITSEVSMERVIVELYKQSVVETIEVL